MSHYFTNENLKSEIREIKTKILGHDFIFLTDNGVFSKDKIDFGSRLFLENIDLFNIFGKVLDVGCGYGTIGLVVSKLTNSEVTMCDVNKRAL
ncbi:MAG: methyltransferase, partial [Bacilli bacterium]|nr:methyltransferase [Bacilli bacterium]